MRIIRMIKVGKFVDLFEITNYNRIYEAYVNNYF